jgi:predicted methyltransferase
MEKAPTVLDSNKMTQKWNKGYLLLESVITFSISMLILSALSSSIIHMGKLISQLHSRIAINSEFITQTTALSQLITHAQSKHIQNNVITLHFSDQKTIQISFSNSKIYLKHGRSGRRIFIENISTYKIISSEIKSKTLQIQGAHLNVDILIQV